MIILKIVPIGKADKMFVAAESLRRGGGVFPMMSIPLKEGGDDSLYISDASLVTDVYESADEVRDLVDNAMQRIHKRLWEFLRVYGTLGMDSQVIIEYVYRDTRDSAEPYGYSKINLYSVVKELNSQSLEGEMDEHSYFSDFCKKIKNEKFFPEIYIAVADLLVYRSHMLSVGGIEDIDEKEYKESYLENGERGVVYAE